MTAIAIASRHWDRGRLARSARKRGRDARGPRRHGARRDAQHRRGEPVPAARHGLDDGLRAVTDGVTHLAHAMRQRFLGYGHIRPDRLQQLFLGHQAIRILREIVQQLEALPPQRNLAICASQRVARDIERISSELQHLEPAQQPPAVSKPRWR